MWDDEGLKVLPPWTPIEVDQCGEDYDLCVWGRKYSVHTALLPTAIESQGRQMLAGPMRVNAVVNGQPAAWQRSGTRLMRREDGVVILCGWQALDDLYLNTAMRLEYDGTMRIDLTMVPVTGKQPGVEQLWLEIPFAPEVARLYHYWPQAGGGTVQAANSSNSGAVAGAMTLPFRPFIWLGDEKAGIEWFCESDQYWQVSDESRALEVLPGEGETVLRVHFIDGPYRPWKDRPDGWGGATVPWTVTFGLQATPVKDMARAHDGQPHHCNHWNMFHTWSGNLNGGQVFLHEMPVAAGASETYLDRLVARGVRTVVIHEAWNTIQNYYNVDLGYAEGLKAMIRAFHERGIRVLPYHGYELSSLNPEWADNFREGLVMTADGGFTGGWIREPAQRDYIVCHRSQWVKKWERGLESLMEEFGFDGVYLDGTIMPWGCANERHGCGYTDENGKRHMTYPLFSVRAVMREMYAYMHAHGRYIDAHQSSCCFTPAMSYVDNYWDGEHIQSHITEDILSTLPLEAFRAEYIGTNFGVHSEFLAYPRGDFWTWENALAIALPHGVLPRPLEGDPVMLDSVATIWQAREDFGIAKAQWHPYWENGGLVSASAPDIYISFYARDRGRGMELLLASHIANADAPEVAIDLSGWVAAGHPLPAGARAVTGGPARLNGTTLTLDFKRFSSAVVWLHG